MKTRKATIGDIQQITSLLLECKESQLNFKGNRPLGGLKKTAADLIEKSVQKDFKDGEVAYFVAYNESKSIGVLRASIRHMEKYINDKVGQLDSLFVSCEKRNMGVARSLVDNALQWFKQKSIHTVRAKVLSDNHIAQKAWESYGFTDIIHEKFLDLTGGYDE